jgi:heavy metal efflux system protein
LLYSLFNSIRECLLTLAGIPFTAAGGVLALYISGLNFSISAAIGFISLFGVSVMIGILLITYYNQASGFAAARPWVDAMFHAASGLMRPLLMMSLSAASAFSRGDFHGHRQRGAASAGHRGRGRHVVRPVMLLLVVPALSSQSKRLHGHAAFSHRQRHQRCQRRGATLCPRGRHSRRMVDVVSFPAARRFDRTVADQ